MGFLISSIPFFEVHVLTKEKIGERFRQNEESLTTDYPPSHFGYGGQARIARMI